MGASKRYYYIKTKHKASQSDAIVSHEQPQVIFQPLISNNLHARNNESVLDMDFKVKACPKLWLRLLRWGIFLSAIAIIYFAGTLLNIGAEYVKGDILRKGKIAGVNLQNGAEALSSLDLDNAMRNFNLAQRNFTSAMDDFASLGQGYLLSADLTLNHSQLFQGQLLMDGGNHLAEAGINVIKAFKPVIEYWNGASTTDANFSEMGDGLTKVLLDNSKYIDTALNEVGLAKKAFQKLDTQYIPLAYVGLVEEAKQRTDSLSQALEMSEILAKRLPVALGFNNPRYYLVLNQNSNELRATGGFIGSYVFLELYKGKLETVFVDDIHRIDGQNRYSNMELPTPLQEVTAYYGMRDANWEPDFPTSARTIQKLYEQAGGGTVDGIIALTPQVVSDILAITGSVYMPEYNINLTAANFIEKTQKHIEIEAQENYNPKQLLVDVAPIIINRLLDANSKQINLIGKKLLLSLITKDILLNFIDPQLESVVNDLNWGGEIQQVSSKDDYLCIVESNLGGNKSSSSITREISHNAIISNNKAVLDNLEIIYTHEGTNEYPDGINKNYVRVYLPTGVKITKTSGYDANTQIDIDVVNGKTMIGFWVTTAPKESSVVKMEYLLPFRLDASQYRLVVQKQPGMKKTRLQSQVEFNKKRDILFADQLIKDEIISTIIRN